MRSTQRLSLLLDTQKASGELSRNPPDSALQPNQHTHYHHQLSEAQKNVDCQPTVQPELRGQTGGGVQLSPGQQSPDFTNLGKHQQNFNVYKPSSVEPNTPGQKIDPRVRSPIPVIKSAAKHTKSSQNDPESDTQSEGQTRHKDQQAQILTNFEKLALAQLESTTTSVNNQNVRDGSMFPNSLKKSTFALNRHSECNTAQFESLLHVTSPMDASQIKSGAEHSKLSNTPNGFLAARYNNKSSESMFIGKSVEALTKLDSGSKLDYYRSEGSRQTGSNQGSDARPKLPATAAENSQKTAILNEIRSTLNQLEDMCAKSVERTKAAESRSINSKMSKNKSQRNLPDTPVFDTGKEFFSVPSGQQHLPTKPEVLSTPKTQKSAAKSRVSAFEPSVYNDRSYSKMKEIESISPIQDANSKPRFDFTLSANAKAERPKTSDGTNNLIANSVLFKKLRKSVLGGERKEEESAQKPVKSIKVSMDLIDQINQKYRRSKLTSEDVRSGRTLNPIPEISVSRYSKYMNNTMMALDQSAVNFYKKPNPDLRFPDLNVTEALYQDRSLATLRQRHSSLMSSKTRLLENMQQLTELNNHQFFKHSNLNSSRVIQEYAKEGSRISPDSPTSNKVNALAFGAGPTSAELNVYRPQAETKKSTRTLKPLLIPVQQKELSFVSPTSHPTSSRSVNILDTRELSAIPARLNGRKISENSLENQTQVIERISLLFEAETRHFFSKINEMRADYESKMDVYLLVRSQLDDPKMTNDMPRGLRVDLSSKRTKMKYQLNEYFRVISANEANYTAVVSVMRKLQSHVPKIRTARQPEVELDLCIQLSNEIKRLISIVPFKGKTDMDYYFYKVADELRVRQPGLTDRHFDQSLNAQTTLNGSTLLLQKGESGKTSTCTAEINSVLNMIERVRNKHNLANKERLRAGTQEQNIDTSAANHCSPMKTQLKPRREVFKKLNLQGIGKREGEVNSFAKRPSTSGPTLNFRPISWQAAGNKQLNK